jgi:hypothetical protein
MKGEASLTKRLMVGLMAGGLMAAMLPGAASASPGNPDVSNTGICVAKYQFRDRAADPANGLFPWVSNKNKDKQVDPPGHGGGATGSSCTDAPG